MPSHSVHSSAVRARGRVGSRSLTPAVLQLGIVGLALAGAVIAIQYSAFPVDPPWIVVLGPIVGCVELAAGIVAWLRRPSNRLGPLMVAAGYVWIATGLTATATPVLVAVGLIVATVPLAMVVHLLHAFPSGRLRGRLSRATVLLGYVVCVVLQAPVYLYGQGPEGPLTVLQIADRPNLDRIGFWVQTGVGSVVMIATAFILWQRLRAATAEQRRVAGPLFAYGIAAVIWVPLSGSFIELSPVGVTPVIVSQYVVLLIVPTTFVLAVLRGGFARTGEIQELGAWLGADEGGRPGLAPALADALGDPSVALAFWVPATGSYVDGDGGLVTLPAAGENRGAVEVTTAGRRVGAIVYDATLIADPALVRAAGRVVALALDRERLTAELRASREGLRVSRTRIVEAADGERRRLAHDLHDGLQTRLVLLAMEAGRLDADGNGGSAAELRSGLDDAITELREIVQGVMPAALTERGLYAAAEDLADRVPIPVALELEPDAPRLPAPVESTGYFVVSEALANAVKHSRAHELRVGLARADGCLRIEVADDGIGGARPDTGAGLRGMADRVDALDGRLEIESRPGAGTRVVAEVPCA